MHTVIELPLAEPPSLLEKRFWGVHLLLVAALAVSIALSVWQFDVWQASRRAQEHDNSGLPPVALTTVITQGAPYPGNDIGRPVTLEGTWVPNATFYVQGMRAPTGRMGGASGYWVVTPVNIAGNVIPVLRGWVSTTSAPAVQAESVALTGWLEPSDDTNPVEVRPGIYGSLSLAALAQNIQEPLYSGYVVAKSASSGLAGSEQLGPTQTSVTGVDWGTGLRNFLYGVQWLLFGGLAVYLWWRWCRDQRYPPTNEPVASETS